MPVALDEESRKRKLSETISKPVNMTSHGPLAEQVIGIASFSYFSVEIVIVLLII